jgi:sugar (pentulose or hexulose) kinase
MIELMEVQIASSRKSQGSTLVNKVYIDGGFTDNDIFVKLVSYHFRNCKVRTTESPLGSALGAALVISDKVIGKNFLKNNYNLKKHKPLILQSD